MSDLAKPRSKSARVPAALFLGVAAVLLAAAVVFFVRADHLRNSGPASNQALIDKTATTQVIGQVSTALNQVLSYSYKNPAPAQAAATKWLAGDAVGQYHLLFSQLEQSAPHEKLTFVAKVVTAGVSSLHGNTAQLLVFLDQRSTRASDNESSVSAAQVQITAVRHGATWQITELHPI